MTPVDGGRYCAACAKTVVDFTSKTDAEILAFFRQADAGRTCGRFQAEQLGRPLRQARPVARPPRWQLWLAGLLVSALSVQSCQPTTDEVQPTTARRLPPPPPPPLGMPTVDSATVGDIKTLLGDTVLVSHAPKVASAPPAALPGEAALQ